MAKEEGEIPGKKTPENPTGGVPNNWTKLPVEPPDPGGRVTTPPPPFSPRPITFPHPPDIHN